jgi:hypothetical protein
MDSYPKYRSHLVPRTRDGWVGTVAFLAILALAMPPITHVLLNRLEPVILGMPFLYAVLMAVYFALVAVLIWVYRRGV